MKSLSRVRLLASPWTAAHQAHPSMGFSRQEYQSGLPGPLQMILLSSVLSSPFLFTFSLSLFFFFFSYFSSFPSFLPTFLLLFLSYSFSPSLPHSSVHGILQQEYWSGLPFPYLENFPNAGIKPMSPALKGEFFTVKHPGSPISFLLSPYAPVTVLSAGAIFY